MSWEEHLTRAELTQLAQDLIRIPSVVRAGAGEAAVATFVAAWLRREGFAVELQEVHPATQQLAARSNVVVRWGTGGPRLLYEAHTDVVTEGDTATWLHPPFAGEIAENRLYGRGACDTKGNLAAAMLALAALKRSGWEPAGQIVLVAPVDEEDMMTGIKHFIRQGGAEGVVGAVICEPEENLACLSQKGALRLAVRVTGVMAHGAMPLTGLNPLPAVARIVTRLVALEAEEIGRLGQHPYLGFPSVTPTVLRAPAAGDAQTNVVPGEVYLALDLRTVPGQEHEDLIARIRGIVAREVAAENEAVATGALGAWREALRPGMRDSLRLSASVTVLDDRPWTETPAQSTIARAVMAAIHEETGREAMIAGVPGATDGTFLQAWAGVPVVVTGAGDRFVPHHADEWVDLDQLWETARIYARTAVRFFG